MYKRKYNVSVHFTVALSSPVTPTVEAKATFQRGSVVICTCDAHSQCTYRWLDIASDTVVSNTSELDICDVQTTSPRDLLCVVTVDMQGEEFNVTTNISADLVLWNIVRNSCTYLNATNSQYRSCISVIMVISIVNRNDMHHMLSLNKGVIVACTCSYPHCKCSHTTPVIKKAKRYGYSPICTHSC